MRIITRIVICSLCICFAQSTSLSQIESVLFKIGESSEKPFTVDEIIELVKAEGVDLEAVFAELGIKKSDVESQAQSYTIARQQAIPPDDDGPDYDLESDEDAEDYTISGARAQKINSISNLSGTSSLIMNMIFSMNGLGGAPTPPPMPVFVDNTPKSSWSNWKAWTSCTSSCGGGSRKRYRQCQRSRGSSASCPGSQRQVSSCNTHDCRK